MTSQMCHKIQKLLNYHWRLLMQPTVLRATRTQLVVFKLFKNSDNLQWHLRKFHGKDELSIRLEYPDDEVQGGCRGKALIEAQGTI